MMLVWGRVGGEDGGSEGVAVAGAARAPSLGHLEVAQVQRLLAGDAPVVGLLAHFVVLQSRLVVHGQPLDGVGGQRLQEHGGRTESEELSGRGRYCSVYPQHHTKRGQALHSSLHVTQTEPAWILLLHISAPLELYTEN